MEKTELGCSNIFFLQSIAELNFKFKFTLVQFSPIL